MGWDLQNRMENGEHRTTGSWGLGKMFGTRALCTVKDRKGGHPLTRRFYPICSLFGVFSLIFLGDCGWFSVLLLTLCVALSMPVSSVNARTEQLGCH
ncbi:hypothetical protein J3F83DRAFT_727155 [Trichoderma novae-zelandiae]